MFSKFKLGKRKETDSDPESNPTLEGDSKLGTYDRRADDSALEELMDDEGRPIPHWREQVTVRAVFTGACLSVLFCIMTLK